MKEQQLPDIQEVEDTREISLDWVGISGYKIPFEVKAKNNSPIKTVGEIKIETNLEAKSKGVNMSRFTTVIEETLNKEVFSLNLLEKMLLSNKHLLGERNSRIVINFDYLIRKKAPTTDHWAHFNVPSNFCAVLKDGKTHFYLEVDVSYTSCCPCSKKISDYGAHNQRSVATVRVKFKNANSFIWIEDLVSMVEEVASSPIYNILKRPDEKWVTEKMYRDAKFVEDTIRDLALKMDKLEEIEGYSIKTSHQESIHQHNAICTLKKGI